MARRLVWTAGLVGTPAGDCGIDYTGQYINVVTGQIFDPVYA